MTISQDYNVDDNVRAMIRTLCANRGIELTDLAPAVEMSVSTLYTRMRENEPTPFKVGELVRIAGHFEVKPQLLLDPLPEDYRGSTHRYLGEILDKITQPEDQPPSPVRRRKPLGGVEVVHHRRPYRTPQTRQPAAEHAQPSTARPHTVPAPRRPKEPAQRDAA